MSIAALRPVLFGIAVRRALGDYLRGVALITIILLMVAWTIDLARHFAQIRAGAELREVPLLDLLLPYLLHRGVDIVTRLLPMACFFGVFIAEIARRLRLESVVLGAAGFTPARGMAAVLWLALILGGLQGMLESKWRPAAVLAQVDTGFGNYAQWYRRGWLFGPVWFVEDEVAIRTEVLRTDQPRLRNVLIFEGIRQPKLTRVIAAEQAMPTTDPLIWRLEAVRIWTPETQNRPTSAQGTLDFKIDLIPEQLSYYGIQEFNIPSAPLNILATRPHAPNAPAIRNAIWRRRTAWLLPGTFALLGVALARRAFSGRVLVLPRLIGMAATGYLTVVSVKVFWTLGQLDALPAAVSVLTPVIGSLLLAWFFARLRA